MAGRDDPLRRRKTPARRLQVDARAPLATGRRISCGRRRGARTRPTCTSGRRCARPVLGGVVVRAPRTAAAVTTRPEHELVRSAGCLPRTRRHESRGSRRPSTTAPTGGRSLGIAQEPRVRVAGEPPAALATGSNPARVAAHRCLRRHRLRVTSTASPRRGLGAARRLAERGASAPEHRPATVRRT